MRNTLILLEDDVLLNYNAYCILNEHDLIGVVARYQHYKWLYDGANNAGTIEWNLSYRLRFCLEALEKVNCLETAKLVSRIISHCKELAWV